MGKRIAVIGLYGMSALFRVHHLPALGETVGSSGLVFEGGGKGYNQALGASRMGAQVFFATAVGRDTYGREAERVFRADGLTQFACLCVEDAPTAFAAVASDASGGNIVMVEQGACARITANQVEAWEREIAASDMLLIQCEMPEEAVLRLLELGKRHGLYTILNPAPARPMPREMMKLVDLLTPNLGEAQVIADSLDGAPELVCRKLMELGCRNVIITLGERGAYVGPQGEKGYLQPPFQVDCVDTTGAGDNFNGALAACLLRGDTLSDAVRTASASSALSVTKRGVLRAIPTGAEVEDFLRRYGG